MFGPFNPKLSDWVHFDVLLIYRQLLLPFPGLTTTVLTYFEQFASPLDLRRFAIGQIGVICQLPPGEIRGSQTKE